MIEPIVKKLKDSLSPLNLPNLFLVLTLVFTSLMLTLPILDKIPPHPDEYQFFANAWSIMSGKTLQNYLHVAFTEYSLTGFLMIINLLTKSGVNFPQGSPSLVTIYYGRVFGLLLYLLTFILGCLIVQKGEKSVKLRTVIFALLYFGSLGLFERFLRVNSDSMMVFIFANYFLLSLFLHRRQAPLYLFYLLNLLFLFLLSFTNLKGLYLALPLLLLNTISPLVWYGDPSGTARAPWPKTYWFISQIIFIANLVFVLFSIRANSVKLLPILIIFVLNSLNPYFWIRTEENKQRGVGLRIYVLAGYLLGLLGGIVLLWFIFMPRPFDPHTFWYGIKNTLVFATQMDFDYPGQSYRSWLIYPYDLVVEYIGLLPFLISSFLLLKAYGRGIKGSLKRVGCRLREKMSVPNLKGGNLFPLTEVILFLSFLIYYLGLSSRVVHWSRWGVPLGFISLILLSVLLEKAVTLVVGNCPLEKVKLRVLALVLVLLAWTPHFILTFDLANNHFPRMDGHEQTYRDVDLFLKEVGIPPEEATQSAAWFTGPTHNVSSISLEQLVEPAYKKVRYILWPQWNLGPLYTQDNVDKSTHNQRAFIDNYAQSVTYRFPSLTSRYLHGIKYFAWKYLGLTYYPELESLTEPQYGVVKLKDFSPPLTFNYALGFNDLSHYFLPKSLVFNLNNLPESYMFPPCYSNPAVAYISTGKEVSPDPETGSRTLGLNCHSLRFRVGFKGIYAIKIEGLPPDLDNSQMVYSAYSYNYDALNRVITFVAPRTFITVEFGVATKESYIPSLKYIVYYRSLTDQDKFK